MHVRQRGAGSTRSPLRPNPSPPGAPSPLDHQGVPVAQEHPAGEDRHGHAPLERVAGRARPDQVVRPVGDKVAVDVPAEVLSGGLGSERMKERRRRSGVRKTAVLPLFERERMASACRKDDLCLVPGDLPLAGEEDGDHLAIDHHGGGPATVAAGARLGDLGEELLGEEGDGRGAVHAGPGVHVLVVLYDGVRVGRDAILCVARIAVGGAVGDRAGAVPA